MNKNVLNTDLSGKVAVVTGAGGVLCSAFSKTLARAGAKVALLDLNFDAAKAFADEINAEGGIAKAYSCNVLDKAICEECKEAYGEEDKENHVGDTELRDAKEATTEEEGYTGDLYCKSCDELIERGEEIPVPAFIAPTPVFVLNEKFPVCVILRQ